MEQYKKLVLLHSNDLHGDFLAQDVDEKLIGGVSMLSGYVKKVRKEEDNVIYCVAGDMFRGSVIDSEYHGLSTIEIMNMMAPDVVTIGNHETDYGLAHLLFIEKCASFPIINANMFVKTNRKRLFKPCEIIKKDGMKIMFIGILTEQVISQTRTDQIIGSLIDVEDAAREIEKIVNSYKEVDIDLTVLLTHIGFEEDKKLAALLNPELGIDIIVGGHSHTLVEEPTVINGIPIVQAGVGTDKIGRFDLEIDMENNCVHDFSWKLIDINQDNCPEDLQIKEVINSYKENTDLKYNRVLTTFNRQLTHPSRYQETELGNLYCDIFIDSLDADFVLLGSGSIRTEQLGPIVKLADIRENYPYSNPLYALRVTGAVFKRMIKYMYRDEMFNGEHTSFYQLCYDLKIVYNRTTHEFEQFDYEGHPIEEDKKYKLILQKYSYDNMETKFGITKDDLNGKPKIVSTSDFDIIEEYLSTHSNIDAKVENRLVVVE